MRMSGPPAPTVILIGGECRLASGAELDTRTPIEGDPWDVFLREVLNRSELWWETAGNLVNLVLDAAGREDAWALTWSQKTARRVQGDGTTKNVRMKSIMGDVVSLQAEAYGRYKKSLEPSDFRNLDANIETARYRMVESWYRIVDVRAEQSPAVFLGGFHSESQDGSDIIRLSPLDYIAERWPAAVIVLPHTPLIQRKVEALVEWHAAGRLPSSPLMSADSGAFFARSYALGESERYVREVELAKDLVDGKPVAVDGDFRVTFLVDHGAVRNPNDLQAAQEFVMNRYDLDIGLWDLARDPVLRETLSRPGEVENVNMTQISVPKPVVNAAASARAAKERSVLSEKQAREKVHGVLWPQLDGLGEHSWSVPPNIWTGWVYLLQIGPFFPERVDGDLMDRATGRYQAPWMSFMLNVLKRDTRFKLSPAVYRYGEQEWDLLNRHSAEIREIIGADGLGKTYEIGTVRGQGWADGEYDGLLVSQVVGDVLSVLSPSWEEIVGRAVAAYDDYRQETMLFVEDTRGDEVGKTMPSKGLLRRLFQRDD
jgi:hypothetical protein